MGNGQGGSSEATGPPKQKGRPMDAPIFCQAGNL